MPTDTPTPAPIRLGNTHAGSSFDVEDSNWLDGSPITVGSNPLHVNTISVYVGPIDTNSANDLFQVAIYADNAARPDTLVATSASVRLTAGNAWNTAALSATLSPDTTYWLIYNSNGRTYTVNNLATDPGTSGQGVFSNSGVDYGVWTTTFPPSTIISAYYSIYVTGY